MLVRPQAKTTGTARLLTLCAAACSLVVAVVGIVLLHGRAAPAHEVIGEYCVDCHNAIDWEGGISFVIRDGTVAAATTDDSQAEAAIWEKAVRKISAGMMPPANAARPQPATLESLGEQIEARLDREWAAAPDPGAEPLSRLNRTEYANAIRDLLAFDAGAVVDALPADEIVAGFDNIGDGLTVSPTLIEAYVAAALTIARQAVGDRTAVATQVRYEPAADLAQDRHIDGLPLGTRGGFVFTHWFPLDAVYEFRIVTVRGPGIARQSFCPPPEITVALNGEVLAPGDATAFRMTVPAGPQSVAVALVDSARCAGVNELHDVYSLSGGIRHVEIHGPFEPSGPGDTPSRRAIFSCVPANAEEEPGCAREIIARLARRAYRRPIDPDGPDLAMLTTFYEAARRQGSFEDGIQAAIARILMSPQFVFQFEHEPAGVVAGEPYRLTDLEIATRLAFFLWSSLPDEALLSVAAEGALTQRDMLERQITRMLADDKAGALIENFAGQWLGLRELREALPQDPRFDANLRAALEAETTLLFSAVAMENRSVLDLLDADFTYLNERLAEHYGIEDVRGSYMRPVALDAASPRRGLLGHGSWLTATSVADRTSPVIRGEWFITKLLGAPVPEPPPGVEADLSDEAPIAREDDTLRQRLERHRANPTCAACHRIMDPIGLALENFDLIGSWREQDNGRPIDARAELIDGTVIEGPADLRAMLQAKPRLFVTALTEKLLTYAIGRVVDHRDMPAVRRIVRDAERDDYRFQSLVHGVVNSAPFLMRTKMGGRETELASRGGDMAARRPATPARLR